MSDLPPANRNYPPLLDEWIEEPTIVKTERQTAESVRWALDRHGELVMWGEGDVDINFNLMGLYDHHGYRLLVGENVGPQPEDFHALVTPEGDRVGKLVGTVSHKMEPDMSPDIRAVAVDEE